MLRTTALTTATPGALCCMKWCSSKVQVSQNCNSKNLSSYFPSLATEGDDHTENELSSELWDDFNNPFHSFTFSFSKPACLNINL